jgi:sulfate transport system permease protein
MARFRFKQHSVLPGFGLSLGFTVFYLSLIVLLPLAALFQRSFSKGWGHFWDAAWNERAIAAYKLTFLASFGGALVNLVFGFLLAWALTRYRFPGRRILDAVVDLPFALPTAVSGIALATIYSTNGWVGQWFDKINVKISYTPLGVMVALTFIGLPFVVRTVQPALQDLEGEIEEASASLGASRWQTFYRVILPLLLPALLTGFALSFARALGEYGSVVFISGNMPMRTEIAPLLIVQRLEDYDYAGATAIAVMTLAASFVLLLIINMLQRWGTRRAA